MMEKPFFAKSRNSKEVVCVPVHFMESTKTRSAALNIQKVFRGFLMRKRMKKIIGIKTEVEAIERRISQRETIDLIKKDLKERLNVNEMLMRLLFQLDSIRGVRDPRKAVIKKAILLQERVDSIVAGDGTSGKTLTLDVNDDGNIEKCVVSVKTGNRSFEFVDLTDSPDSRIRLKKNLAKKIKKTLETQEQVEIASGPENVAAINERNDAFVENEGSKVQESIRKNDQMLEENMETEKVLEQSENSQSVVEGGEAEEVMEMQQTEEIRKGRADKAKTCGNLMEKLIEKNEKLIEKNEKLIGLVTQLCEKNASQIQSISSLSHRVQNLERAFRIDMSRGKKRKRQDKEEMASNAQKNPSKP